MKFAHIADIHLRGLSRHAEYTSIIADFVEKVKSDHVDYIVIAGDIFHTKTTGLSPEYFDFMNWMLGALSDVAPVIIFLGNHDGTLINLQRQDAVTPIVNALHNSNVVLYKNSGAYEFAPGFAMCVMSIFDKKNWEEAAPIPGCVNIACYHGPVAGAHTDDNWVIDDNVKVSAFEKYDFAFLGDIHKPQNLAYRDVNGQQKPWIAYPGSMMQQNYGEGLDHGYLLWDIRSRDDFDVEFKPLINPQPFVTIEWKGGLKKVLEKCKEHPKQSRFRVKVDHNLSQAEIQKLTNVLRKEHDATEVTFKIDSQIDRNTLTAGTIQLERADLRNVDVVLKLMKDFYKKVSASEDVWVSIHNQVQRYISAVSSEDTLVRNVTWTLRNMKFDNTFSYGDDNVVNFDDMSGIVGIFGNNRSGKSSIVGTLMYTLFNTTDRGPMKNLYVVNTRKPYCVSRATVEVSGVDYLIERQTVKMENKKGPYATTSLNVYQIDENGKKDLGGDGRIDTEKVVRKLIGNADDFLMTSLSAQGDVNLFITHGSTKRKQIVSKFLDVDIFDKMHDLASKDENIVLAQLKQCPDRDWDVLIDKTNKRIVALKNQLAERSEQLDRQRDRLGVLQKQYIEKYGSTLVTREAVEQQRTVLTSLGEQLRRNTSARDVCASELKEIAEKIEKASNAISQHDLAALKQQLDAFKTLESSLAVLRVEHQKDLIDQQRTERTVSILSEVPCGDHYPTCKFIKDAHANKENVALLKAKTELALSRVKSAEAAMSVMNGSVIVDTISKVEKLSDLLSRLKLDESRKNVEMVRLAQAVKSCEESVESAAQRFAELESAVRDDVDVITTEIKVIEKNIKKLDDEKLTYASQIGKEESDLEKIDLARAQRELILTKHHVFEMISDAFSKKGIPSVIVSSQLPLINAEIARILHGIVDFTVELEADDNTDALEVYINYGDSKRIIELGSGMEKVVSSLAIRVALINVSSLSKTNMFIIDEGFSALDDASIEACNRLLMSLKRYFHLVLIISHIDGIKDAVDQIVEITKIEKDTKIVYDSKIND